MAVPRRGNFVYYTSSCNNDESTFYFAPASDPATGAPAAAAGNGVDWCDANDLPQASPTQADFMSEPEDDENDNVPRMFDEDRDGVVYDHPPDAHAARQAAATATELEGDLDDSDDGRTSGSSDDESDHDADDHGEEEPARRSTRTRRRRELFKPYARVLGESDVDVRDLLNEQKEARGLRYTLNCLCKKCKIASLQVATAIPRVVKYSYNKVMGDKHLREVWQEACGKEFAQFLEPGRTEWGIPEKGDRVIWGFWRLLEFFSDAGHLIKRKARFCTRGDLISAKDNDFDFSFSATMSHDQVRLLAGLCATSEKMLYTSDVRGAYLSVPRETKPGHRTLWLKPPPGCEHPDNPNLMLRIKTCLYGLRDSGRRW